MGAVRLAGAVRPAGARFAAGVSRLAPMPALPARFRRPSLLIVGCGDVGMRVLRHLPPGRGGEPGRRTAAATLVGEAGLLLAVVAFVVV